MTTENFVYFPPEDIQALNETHPLPEGMKWVGHSRTCPVCVYSYPRRLYVAWVFIDVSAQEKHASFAPRDYDPTRRERIPVPSLEDGIELIYMRMLLGVDQP